MDIGPPREWTNVPRLLKWCHKPTLSGPQRSQRPMARGASSLIHMKQLGGCWPLGLLSQKGGATVCLLIHVWPGSRRRIADSSWLFVYAKTTIPTRAMEKKSNRWQARRQYIDEVQRKNCSRFECARSSARVKWRQRRLDAHRGALAILCSCWRRGDEIARIESRHFTQMAPTGCTNIKRMIKNNNNKCNWFFCLRSLACPLRRFPV